MMTIMTATHHELDFERLILVTAKQASTDGLERALHVLGPLHGYPSLTLTMVKILPMLKPCL